MKRIQHNDRQPNEGEWLRDGDHDGFETVFTIPQAAQPYTFRNPLGRAVRRVEIVDKEAACDWYPALDSTNQRLWDLEKIILKFTAATRVKLRVS
jgi:hypothetical protein